MDKELLIKAAMVGFAASDDGFHGAAAFSDRAPSDEDIAERLELNEMIAAAEVDDFTRAAVERALKLAGLL